MDVFKKKIMLNDILLRTYQPSDFESVLLLHKEGLIQTNAYTGKGPWDDDLLDIENHYLKKNGWFVVGEYKNELVTMGAIRKITTQQAEIKRMRTKPQLQGNGIGKKILEALIEKAVLLGYKEIILETSDRQIAAEKLYMAYGFIPYQKENIRGLNCTWYKKVLMV
jgi:putative acetyltransferase